MTDNKKVNLQLNAYPDGHGFFYGKASLGDEFCMVNVLPPKNQWVGDVELPDFKPHEEDWIIYADGEEIARVKTRDDLETAIAPKLMK